MFKKEFNYMTIVFGLLLCLSILYFLIGCAARYEFTPANPSPAPAPGTTTIAPGPTAPSPSPSPSPAPTSGPQGPQGATGPAGAPGLGSQPGLVCGVYSVQVKDESGTVNWNTLLSDGTLEFTTILTNFNVPNESNVNDFASFSNAQQALLGYVNYTIDCEGYITVPETGLYTFTDGSDDGSDVFIDSTSIIAMSDLQAFTTQTKTVSLLAGPHKFNLLYFQGPPVMIGLQLSWQGPANQGLGTMTIVPSSAFTH